MNPLEAMPPPVPYRDPWVKPLGERLAMLARGSMRVAYFYETANNSTFRYRAYNMAQVLNECPQEGISASYFFLSDYLHFDEIADNAHVLVICRSRYSAALSHLIAKFRARRRRVLFDVDDLVFDPDYTRLLVSTLGLNPYDEQVWDQWFAMTSRLGAAMKECDWVITTNGYLAGRISAYCGLQARVVPNFLNKEQLEISDRIYEARAACGFARGEQTLLGYFSGSPSHRLDYSLVEPALMEVMERNRDVHLMVVGYIEPTPALEWLMDRVVKVPFQDYVNLQRVIGSADINLMPLQSNAFTHCKSELKYFDAAAVGTVSIASPTFTYADVIQDGVNGFLAHAHQWQSSIQTAIDSSERHAAIAHAGRAIVDARFGWTTQRAAILGALDG
jgi:glycosyltransferase involved in cell wall biosynthesis